MPTLLFLVGNLSHFIWVRHSSQKSSATHSYNCVQYFHVSKLVSQTVMHAIAHGGCMDTVRESALEADPGEKNPLPHQGLELQ